VIYPGAGYDARTQVWVTCDYRSEPCPRPQSDVPKYECGRADEVRLDDSPALLTARSGNTVMIALDANKLPAGLVPRGLARDLASRKGASGPRATLTEVWVQTMLHQGVRGGPSLSFGPGGDVAFGKHSVPIE
jgi:hypothetical protein